MKEFNLPNFLCVGTQKGGTTSLYNILTQHSQIAMSEKKEVHFFDRDTNYDKGTEWYSKKFEGTDHFVARGEITPNYMYSEKVPERIFKTLGEQVKLIFMLRNPAERAFSHYKMRIARGFENNRFKKSVQLELKELSKKAYSLQHRYIDRGFYDIQINRFLQLFKIENMFFMIFEDDFLLNRKRVVKQLLEFLGVNENEEIAFNIKSNPSTFSKNKRIEKVLNTAHPLNKFTKKLIPSKKMRTNIKYFFTKLNQKPTADKKELEAIKPYLINEIYKESIINLEKVIDRDLSSWYKL